MTAIRVEQVPVPSHGLDPSPRTNAYWIACGGEAVLVDPGFTAEEGLHALLAAWEALGRPVVRALLVTHGHLDHVAGAEALRARFGVPVLAHPREAERVARVVPRDAIGPLREGDRLAVGGASVEVLETPGHAPGHLSFWIPGERVLLCGDVLAGEGTVWVGPPDGDMRAYLETLRRLEALAPRRAGPGHGPWIERPVEAIRQLIAHRLERERQVLAAVRQGLRTAAEIARALYGDALPARVRPFAELTVTAHLEKLAAEGRVVLGPGGEVRPAEAGGAEGEPAGRRAGHPRPPARRREADPR